MGMIRINFRIVKVEKLEKCEERKKEEKGQEMGSGCVYN